MLNLLKALLTATTAAAVILGAAYIAASISPVYANKLETLEPPARSTFTYVGCITTDEFDVIFDEYNGRLASTADIQDANVFVVVYPDNTFGLYIFLLGVERVCALSFGSFEPLIIPGRNI